MKKLIGIFTTSPALASVHQYDVNHTYRFLICINTLFFVGLFMAMTVFIIKNRKTGLNMVWSMVPAIILLLIVGLGWTDFRDHHSGETFYAVKFSQ